MQFGLMKNDTPLFFLVGPKIRLLRFAASLELPALFDPVNHQTLEMRIYYIPWYKLSSLVYSHIYLQPNSRKPVKKPVSVMVAAAAKSPPKEQLYQQVAESLRKEKAESAQIQS